MLTMENPTKLSLLAVSLLVLAVIALPCLAQTESLLIGPGDSLDIQVFDTPEMSQQVRVTDAGTIRLPFIGDLRVAGKTPPAAAKLIEETLISREIMQHPQVAVRVEEYATQDVSVVGQVQNPGNFPVATPQPILKVLALAGGLTSEADRNVTIERHGTSEKIQVYISNNMEQAGSNLMINPGDTVVVARAEKVYLLGDVAKPGGYVIATNDSRLSLLQLIAMAGSANKTAIQSRVKLIRTTAQGQKELTLKLDAMEKGKRPDIPLQAGDVVYVPFSWMRNAALNASSIAAATTGAAIYTAH